MAQAKKKAATKTAKKTTAQRKNVRRSGMCYEKYKKGQKSYMVFVISMTFLAATLLFADLMMMTA